MNYIFASDPHGTGPEWISKIEKMLSISPNSKIVFGGDYIDGRPYSKDTLLFVKKQVDENGAIALMGNHEELMLKTLSNFHNEYSTFEEQLWIHNGGMSTLDSFVNEDSLSVFEKLNRIKDLYPEIIEWVSNLPYFYETDEIFFTHAGVDWSLKDPLHQTNNEDRLWIRDDYIYQNNKNVFAHNSTNKVIVTGHTPTVFINGVYEGFENYFENDNTCPVTIIKYPNEKSRVFTDGGCHGKSDFNKGNVVLFDKSGEVIGSL